MKTANARINIISASSEISVLLSDFLVKNEFSVKISENTDDVNNTNTDLILFDYALGDAEAKKAVKTNLPIILILPDEEKDKINYSYSLGACDFVSQPIIKNLLLARINSQLNIVSGVRDIEKANKELYDFCMPISHDLKAPFTVISTFTEFLKEELKEKGNEKIENLLTVIGTNTMNMKKIIESYYHHAEAESCHTGGYVRTKLIKK